MAENIETRISSEQAKEAIYKINKLSEKGMTPEQIADAVEKVSLITSSASEIDGKVIPVDTIALLRAKTVTPSTVWVSGYHTKNDGAFGSNIFRWNPTSTDTDNGGTIIKLTSIATGRYELQTEYHLLNIAWFGANKTRIDNQIPIQLALDSIENNTIFSGIFIPSGNFTVTAGVIRKGNNNRANIIGAGVGNSTIVVKSNIPTKIPYVISSSLDTGNSDTVVEGFNIECNNKAIVGLDYKNSNVFISKMRIFNAKIGFRAGSWGTSIRDVVALSCNIGLMISSQGSEYQAVTIDNFYAAGGEVGIQSDDTVRCNDVKISNCVIDSCTKAGIFFPVGGHNIVIDKTYFESCGSLTSSVEVPLSINTFDQTSASVVIGFNFADGDLSPDLKIIDCYFSKNNSNRMIKLYKVNSVNIIRCAVSTITFVDTAIELYNNNSISGKYRNTFDIRSKNTAFCNTYIKAFGSKNIYTASSSVESKPLVVEDLSIPSWVSKWGLSKPIEIYESSDRVFVITPEIAHGYSEVLTLPIIIEDRHRIAGRAIRINFSSKSVSMTDPLIAKLPINVKLKLDGVVIFDKNTGPLLTYYEAGLGTTVDIPSNAIGKTLEIILSQLQDNIKTYIRGFSIVSSDSQ